MNVYGYCLQHACSMLFNAATNIRMLADSMSTKLIKSATWASVDSEMTGNYTVIIIIITR